MELLVGAIIILACFHTGFLAQKLTDAPAFSRLGILSFYLEMPIWIFTAIATAQVIISYFPRKLYVVDDSIVVKSLSYFSFHIPLNEIRSVEDVSVFKVLFSPGMWPKLWNSFHYYDPWFWKISAYREATSRPATRPLSNHPRLEFDSDERSEIRKSQRPDDRRPQQQRDYNRRPQQQQRDYNRRPQGPQRPQRPQREERKPEVKTFDPSTPNSSPPRSERPDTTSDVYYGDEEREVVMQTTVPEPVILDYSGLPPPPKRLSFKPKKTIVVEEKDN
jgi:hypothetical protein